METEIISSGLKKIKLSDRNGKIGKSIVETAQIIFNDFIFPVMFLLIIFLGALHVKYPYESTLQEDLNVTLGIFGQATYSIYNIGQEDPKWFYYFFIILGGFIYFTIDKIYSRVKYIWKSGDDMSAQEVIDDIDSEMKGGNKY